MGIDMIVSKMLAESPYVQDYQPGEKGEGGECVTMVELKELG
jgi:dsDNA-specific endonuclease/ATPase MutS2